MSKVRKIDPRERKAEPQPEWPDLAVPVFDEKGRLTMHEVKPVVADGKATYDVRHDDDAVSVKLALACSEFIKTKRERDPKAVADVLTKEAMADTTVSDGVPSGEVGAFERSVL